MRFARAIALWLIATLTPISSEVAEMVAHLARHGDLVHLHQGDTPGSDEEHGCSPIFHACSCHPNVVFTLASGQKLPPPVSSVVPSAVLTPRGGREREPPPIRPPIG